MRRIERRSFVGLLGGGVIAGQKAHSQSHPQTAAGDLRHPVHSVSVMIETANHFLGALGLEQKAKAIFPFEDEERMRWFYTPEGRKGLPLRDMNIYQSHLAHALLAAGLSQEGYVKAVTVMSLQEFFMTGGDEYYFSIFGEPSQTGNWGYRVEGHHFSQNYTVKNGQVVNGPSFFGALPAEVTEAILAQSKVQSRKGRRTLAQEEDLGFETIHALDEPLQKVAIVDPKAYGDILTVNSRTAALKGQASGLPASKMNGKQLDALRALMEVYVRNLPDDMAQRRRDQINKAARNAWFAWAGGTLPGGPHYYRVQTASFVIEFDNLDRAGNHIHSVWRDFAGDWGGDLLETHYQTSHRAEKA